MNSIAVLNYHTKDNLSLNQVKQFKERFNFSDEYPCEVYNMDMSKGLYAIVFFCLSIENVKELNFFENFILKGKK